MGVDWLGGASHKSNPIGELSGRVEKTMPDWRGQSEASPRPVPFGSLTRLERVDAVSESATSMPQPAKKGASLRDWRDKDQGG